MTSGPGTQPWETVRRPVLGLRLHHGASSFGLKNLRVQLPYRRCLAAKLRSARKKSISRKAGQ
jgi:hypothetical protein